MSPACCGHPWITGGKIWGEHPLLYPCQFPPVGIKQGHLARAQSGGGSVSIPAMINIWSLPVPTALPGVWRSIWVFPSHQLVLQQLLRCHRPPCGSLCQPQRAKQGESHKCPGLCMVWSSPRHRHHPGSTGQGSVWSPQVPSASCHQPAELHLFSQPCVVPAPSVLTPDPAGLLFSSFTSPVYLASAPCRGSARLAPAPRCPQVVPKPQHP